MDQYFASTLERMNLPAPGSAYTIPLNRATSLNGAVAAAAISTVVAATGVAVGGVAEVASTQLSGGKYICMLGLKRFFLSFFYLNNHFL